VSLQIVYGAFMAGLRAGHIFPTFPLMYGSLFPVDVAFALEPWWRNLIMSPHGIHAIHRTLGWVVLLAVAATFVALRGKLRSAQQRLARWGLLAAVVTAVTLGAITVLLHVPVWSGVAHQGAGVLVLSLALALAHAYQPNQAEGRP
jgi:cytochrome c oxidase assembly protein subunit 15